LTNTNNSKNQADKVRVAEYVRMSTDHQQYSTENQADVIHKYAEAHNMEIVKTYSDDGKSGLQIKGREALQRLIDDVKNKQTDFEAILVYDISRWGRFQDADESAYYEFICHRSGISVHFCAEQFENDGSPYSTMFKGFKRAMAGEYSRELSTKVFAGQCRLIELGFRQGGTAGFGLRRMRIDQSGTPQGILDLGEHKSLQTDRVILVPGPEDEIKTVNWMYREFVDGGKLENEIADILNQRGIQTDLGRPWNRGTVHQVLSNEKYIGNNVYNHQSFKLKKKRIVNTPEMWVRADGAFEGIVDPQLFFTAQGMIRERKLVVNTGEAATVQMIFERFLTVGSATVLSKNLAAEGVTSKRGKPINKGYLYKLLKNQVYIGKAVHKGTAYPGEHEAIITLDLWNKVRTIIKESPRTRANHTRAQTPALLKGLIFGADGRAMTPAHTKKKGRLYRYYVAAELLKGESTEGIVRRVPAAEIETAVIDQVRGLMRAPEIIVATWRNAREQESCITEAEVREALQSLDPLWDELFPAEQARVIQLLVERIEVHPDKLDLKFRVDGLQSLVTDLDSVRRAA
jgi:DNA invertase Pin-like site-specific DNA recombinase